MKDKEKLQYIANRLKAKIGKESGPLTLKTQFHIEWCSFTFVAWANGIAFAVRWVSPRWIKENDKWIDEQIIDPLAKLWDLSAKSGTYPEITKMDGDLLVIAE